MASSLRILDHSLVSPPPGTAAAILPFTLYDVLWIPTGPVQRLFFYSSPDPTTHLSSLTSSLSAALRLFPPLAGRVRPSATPSSPLEIQYLAGDSVSFTVAESDDDFHHLSSNNPRDSATLTALAPHLVDGGLLALQVTLFPGRGLCIGVAVHHVACDDSSALHFVKSWAAAACSSAASAGADQPPVFDRSIISDTGGLYSKFLTEIQSLKPPPLPSSPAAPPPPQDLVFASFVLERQHAEKLKIQTLARAAGEGAGAGAAFHCSTFVVACAYAWVCLFKAQGRLAGGGKAHFLFSVDCRGRLVPPVPAEYFGNCLRACFVEADAGQLAGDDGIAAAAVAIGKAIKGLGEGEELLEGAEGWLKRIVELKSERPMSVAGSPKFGVYGVDFGWGRPVKVEVVSIDKTPGTVSLAESKVGDGGGLEMGLLLPRHQMDEFESTFSAGLQLL